MNIDTPLIEQFLAFYILGIIISLFYELLRIFRMLFNHSSFFTGIEDTLFLAIAGVVLFGFSMITGNGEFRLFYLVFAVFGAATYYFTVGKLINIFFCYFTKALKSLLKIILKPIKKLLVIIAHKSSAIFSYLYKKLKSIRNKLYILLKNRRKIVYNENVFSDKEGAIIGTRNSVKAKIKKE